VTIEIIKFNCDCGFSWEKGCSGYHNCSPFYRETIDANQLEISKLKTANAGIEMHARGMGVTITEQQQEIAELKHAVQVQYNAAMTLDEEKQIAQKELREGKS
jgi:hypothetical protein